MEVYQICNIVITFFYNLLLNFAEQFREGLLGKGYRKP